MLQGANHRAFLSSEWYVVIESISVMPICGIELVDLSHAQSREV